MKKMLDNKDGIGLVAMFHQSLLDEQIEWIKGQETKLESKSIHDLPPRTKQEEADMAWDESLSI